MGSRTFPHGVPFCEPTFSEVLSGVLGGGLGKEQLII
jgi:hypothetical protein